MTEKLVDMFPRTDTIKYIPPTSISSSHVETIVFMSK